MSKTLKMLVAGSGLVLFACGSTPSGDDDGGTPTCENGTDFDNDGYGDGCPAGPDCDDYDPTLTTNCPDANCSVGVHQGCPCDPQSDGPVSCYEGPPETAGTPPCLKGSRSCDPISSTWGACGGQVLPEVEMCDFEDNDCDGDIDENVQSECGNCIQDCQNQDVGDDPFPMPDDDPDIDADGVGLNPDGDLILDSNTYTNNFLWIANDPEGTVTKIDTRTGCEVARYATVSHEAGVLINSTGGVAGTVPAWNAASANRPSRTAVDFRKDVWVANRAPSAQASITKIMNVIEDCEDRNGINGIETSSDVSGNCQIEIDNPAEFFAEQDECIKMTVMVGSVASGGWGARAITIDSGIDPGDPGDAWVGIHHEGAFHEIDGRTGALKQRVPPATGSLGINPYGAAVDSTGRLWAVNHAGSPQLVEINTLLSPATYVAPVAVPGAPGSYGIVVDQSDRVWVAGYTGSTVSRYQPATGTGDTVDPFAGVAATASRGLGIDTHGNVWAAAHNPGYVARINADTMAVTLVQDMAGTTPVGVGVDFDGDVWSVNQGTSTASRLHIDQTTLEPAPHPDTFNIVDVFPTGPNPYTYSDFTGLGLRTVTRPSGDYVVPMKGCPDSDEATWLGVEWDATTPPNTHVEIWVRTGNDPATLSAQPIYGPWLVSPADLQAAPGPVPDGQYMELTIRLVSEDGESSPVVHAYSVQWACPGEPIP